MHHGNVSLPVIPWDLVVWEEYVDLELVIVAGDKACEVQDYAWGINTRNGYTECAHVQWLNGVSTPSTSTLRRLSQVNVVALAG
jgi:hypothetical protein